MRAKIQHSATTSPLYSVRHKQTQEPYSELTLKAIERFRVTFESLLTYKGNEDFFINGARDIVHELYKSPCSCLEAPKDCLENTDHNDTNYDIVALFATFAHKGGLIGTFIDSHPCKEEVFQSLLQALDSIQQLHEEHKVIAEENHEFFPKTNPQAMSTKIKTPLKTPPSETDIFASKIQNWFQASQAYSRSIQGTRFRFLDTEATEHSTRMELRKQEKIEAISRSLNVTDRSLDRIISSAFGDARKSSYKSVSLFQKTSRQNIYGLLKLLKETDISPDIKSSFLTNFITLTFDLVHYTSGETPHRRLLSLNTLLSPTFSEIHQSWKDSGQFNDRQISGTPTHDIERLGDCGFVFFHLQPTGCATDMRSRFGKYFYAIPVSEKDFEDKKIMITLTDTAVNSREERFRNSGLIYNAFSSPKEDAYSITEYDHIMVKYFMKKCTKDAYEKVIACIHETEVFVGQEAFIALGLCSLYLYETLKMKYAEEIRRYGGEDRLPTYYLKIKDIIKDMEQFLMSDLTDKTKLNAMFNGWIRPIVKVPAGISV